MPTLRLRTQTDRSPPTGYARGSGLPTSPVHTRERVRYVPRLGQNPSPVSALERGGAPRRVCSPRLRFRDDVPTLEHDER